VCRWAAGGLKRAEAGLPQPSYLPSSRGNKAGIPWPAPEFVIPANAGNESGPTVTAGPNGKPAMVAYEHFRSDLSTIRVNTRRVSFDATSTGNNGAACNNGNQCSSGFCIDNVCCENSCGNGSTNDCQACSITRGGSADGLCTVITNTNYLCRNYADPFCDRLERCDGTNPTCPPDLGRREGVACTDANNNPGVCPANDVTGAPHACQ